MQLFGIILYAAAFPLSGLLGGAIQTFFLFATAPFLAVGYITGGIAWQLFSTPKAYPYGLFVGILLQVWVLMVLWVNKKQGVKKQNEIPSRSK
jgi:hypothetical protein